MTTSRSISIFSLAFLAMLTSCSRRAAPSVSNAGSIATDWSHLESEEWSYSLQHASRVADYHFYPNGTVRIAVGTKSGDTVSVAPIASYWSIEGSTLLFDMGGVAGISQQRLSVVTLTDSAASVVELATGEQLEFTRTFHPNGGKKHLGYPA